MKGMKEFIHNHKKGCMIGGGLFFGILLVFFIIFFVVPAFGDNNYGPRLDDEDKYKISSSTINDIKDTVGSKDGVTKVTYHKEGRILNFTIKLEDSVKLDTAKTYAKEVTDKISKKNLKYYDVQVFLDSKGEDFPIIGYRAKGNDDFSWGNAGEQSEK